MRFPGPTHPTEGERKTVTALFADIKGSMELIEDLDPEEARAIVDPALKLMIAAVHHYDGQHYGRHPVPIEPREARGVSDNRLLAYRQCQDVVRAERTLARTYPRTSTR